MAHGTQPAAEKVVMQTSKFSPRGGIAVHIPAIFRPMPPGETHVRRWGEHPGRVKGRSSSSNTITQGEGLTTWSSAHSSSSLVIGIMD